MKKQVALIVLDGFAFGEEYNGNAIHLANKPNFDKLWNKYPHNVLHASGEAVGLPEGQMGNSEVGHLNLGAGRTVYQSLTRINVAIKNGSFYTNEAFLKAVQNVKDNNKKLHIFALTSDGGVHSHVNHVNALFEMAKRQGLEKVYYHAFLDGRDVSPKSAMQYLDVIAKNENCVISTVGGRYYGMDRDKNYDRIAVHYNCMTKLEGEVFNSYEEGIKASYEKEVLDEFVKPFIVSKEGQIESGDSIIFANFRPDRAIQIATSFSNPTAVPFETSVENITFVSMMKYADSVLGELAFGLQDLKNTYGEFISKNNLKQLRIAETEKYAHVTFFFDGGKDVEIEGSTRILVNSPKVATYDLQPEMSAVEVTDKVVAAIESNEFDTIVLNFANCDMVGHTGNIEASIKAVETVDTCLGRVVEALEKNNGVALITADHGNAEKLLDENGKPFTAHTTNVVPVIVTKEGLEINEGTLGDVAPTLVELLGLEKPVEMEGNSLIKK